MIAHLIHILGVVFIFGVLIISHELGHFWTARKCGVRVELFTFGFGPKLFGFKRGDTLYQVALIPFGGAVKLAGEDGYGTEKPKGDEYFAKTAGQRALILVMGSVHNFVLGFLIFVLVFILGVQTGNLRQPMVGETQPGSPAQSVGIKSGDLITQVAGKKVTDWLMLSKEIHRYPGREITLDVLRGKEVLNLKVIPKSETIKTAKGQETVGLIGILPGTTKEKFGVIQAFDRAGKETVRMTGLIFYYLGKLFIREISPRDLAGPVGIAQMTGQAIQTGWSGFLYFMAFLSVNLSIVNLFPFPMLDGGHAAGVLI
ncbi:MAG: M50 family metallopeptidase, partial [Candidatus Ratteibacteria bacterium]